MPLSNAEGVIGLYFLSSRKIFTIPDFPDCSHLHSLSCEKFVNRTSVRTSKDLLVLLPYSNRLLQAFRSLMGQIKEKLYQLHHPEYFQFESCGNWTCFPLASEREYRQIQRQMQTRKCTSSHVPLNMTKFLGLFFRRLMLLEINIRGSNNLFQQ